MVSTTYVEVRSRVIRESKIIHKSPVAHPLARFFTEETVAMLFNITLEQIDRVECWKNIVYIHAQGVSRFVSYADFPAILGVETPINQDFLRWRKRWRKRWHSSLAPQFWQSFYAENFRNAESLSELFNWGKLVNSIKSVLTETVVVQLRSVFLEQKASWEF